MAIMVLVLRMRSFVLLIFSVQTYLWDCEILCKGVEVLVRSREDWCFRTRCFTTAYGQFYTTSRCKLSSSRDSTFSDIITCFSLFSVEHWFRNVVLKSLLEIRHHGQRIVRWEWRASGYYIFSRIKNYLCTSCTNHSSNPRECLLKEIRLVY